MAGKTLIGSDAHERTIRWMKNEIQSLKNRLSQAGMGEISGDAYEPALGNPPVDHYVLESTIAGVRAWVANGGIGPDLTAIEALAGEGLAARIAANTWALREIAVSGNGLNAVTNPKGIAGNPTLSLNIGTGAAQVAAGDHAHAGVYEPVLGNPAADGYVLSSTMAGVRSWVSPGAPAAHDILSASHGDTTPAAVVRGDLMVGTGATPKWTRYADVAVGSYLASGGVGLEPAWATLNQAAVAGLTTASSPEFVTVKLSGLTDGYIPYHVADATGLANSVLFQSGTNIGFGTTDIEAWTSMIAIELPTAAISFLASPSSVYLMNNIYYDGNFRYKTTAPGSLYYQQVGRHVFSAVASGITDNVAPLIIGMAVTPTGGVHVGGVTDIADNNIYIDGDCSALTFTDRTPYPKNKAEAWAAIKSMKLKAGNSGLDHAALHVFLRSEIKLGDEKDDAGNIIKLAHTEVGRNLGAAVSALVEAVKDINERLLKLEAA